MRCFGSCLVKTGDAGSNEGHAQRQLGLGRHSDEGRVSRVRNMVQTLLVRARSGAQAAAEDLGPATAHLSNSPAAAFLGPGVDPCAGRSILDLPAVVLVEVASHIRDLHTLTSFLSCCRATSQLRSDHQLQALWLARCRCPAEALRRAVRQSDATLLGIIQDQHLTSAKDITAPDRYGKSALIYAAAGKPQALQRLLAVPGVDCNATDWNGRTALHAAAEHMSLECVQLLLGAAAVDVSAVDNWKRTALHCVVHLVNLKQFDIQIVQALMSAPGVKVNQVDAIGRTALHHVCSTYCPGDSSASKLIQAVAEKLLAAGCDPALPDSFRVTPERLALHFGNTALAKLLAQHCGGHSGTEPKQEVGRLTTDV